MADSEGHWAGLFNRGLEESSRSGKPPDTARSGAYNITSSHSSGSATWLFEAYTTRH